MVSVASGQGRIYKVKMRGMHSPTSHFQNVFDVHNFSQFRTSLIAISLTQARIIENVRTNYIIFHLAKHSKLRSKIFKQNFPENYSKCTKIAITACKFLKMFQGSMTQDPHRAYLVSPLASNWFCRKKKNAWKTVKIMARSFKICRYATDLKHL